MRTFHLASAFCTVFASLFASCTVAYGGSISPGVWYEFGYDPNHTPLAFGCQPNDPGGVPCRPGIGSVNLDMRPWTFTSSTPVTLAVTDSLLSGDFFDVYDAGALIGSTPSVPFGAGCGLDPRVCIGNPGISHALFTLPAGGHTLTISVHPAQIAGEGFLEFTAVPEPSTRRLVAASLIALLLLALRRLKDPDLASTLKWSAAAVTDSAR